MNVFLIGASGFLGRYIFKKCPNSLEMLGSHFQNDQNFTVRLDIREKNNMENILTNSKCDVVIHCGSLRIGMCEKNPKLAYSINVEGTKNLVEICKKNGLHLIYISSDAIFDGTEKNNLEQTVPNPLGVFGNTKVESESIICKNLESYCILRTSNLFGWDNKQQNFAQWIIQELSQNKTIQVISDQIITPSYCPNIAEIILEFTEKKINGIYHAAGKESITRADFAKKIANTFNLNEKLLIPTPLSELNLDMKRGKNCSLDTTKIQSVSKTPILSIDEALFDMYFSRRIKDLG